MDDTLETNSQQRELGRVLDSPLLHQSAARFLGDGATEIVHRPNHLFVRLKAEDRDKVIRRLLLIAPYGFTGVRKDLLNVHPEARTVRLKILGKIAEGKKGYRPLIEEVRFLYAPLPDIPTIPELPYACFTDEHCVAERKSWRSWWYAVRQNGWGNFHCLENLSDACVVVLVEKSLKDQKRVPPEALFQGLDESERGAAQRLVTLIKARGDQFFDEPEAGLLLSQIRADHLADLCLLLLNLPETGKHEACTSFAILLKLARADREVMEAKIGEAVSKELSPYYYLEDLQRKLARSRCFAGLPT